jgi:hypothetical protein
MAAKTTIRTRTGKENHMNSSLQVEAYLLSDRETQLPLWSASKLLSFGAVKMLGVGSRTPSIHNMHEDIGGCWRYNQYEIEEGSIIKFLVRRKDGWGGVPKVASIYLKIRENAALRRVTTPTLRVPSRSTMQELEVVGRFDVVTVAEVAAMGKLIHRLDTIQGSNTIVANVFQVEIQEAEIKPKEIMQFTQVTTPSGEQKVMVTQTKTRSIKI